MVAWHALTRRTSGIPVLSFLLLVWFAVFLAQTGQLVANAYNPLPEMDAWEKVAHLDNYARLDASVLWQQHYEHRVLFPELVLAFDWELLKGRQVLPVVLSCVFDLGVWLALLFAVRRSGWNDSFSWCGLFLAGIVMAWPGVAFVLSLPFLLQMVMYQFCSAASLYALSQRRVQWAILLAIVATYSSANGIFVWPVLLLFGFVLRMRRRALLGIAAAGTVSIALFFAGYRSLGNSHPEILFTHPQKFLGYFFRFLGMPFGAVGSGVPDTPTTIFGLAAGIGSLVLCGLLAYFAWRRRLFVHPVAVVGFGICLLALATAAVTTSSRIPLDRPFEQAILTPGRYVNSSAHYWAALLVLLVWVASQSGVRIGTAATLSATVLCAATLFQTGPWVRGWMSQFANYQYATLAIEAGLKTPQMSEMLNYADESLVRRSLGELERKKLALYSWDRYRQIGLPLQQPRRNQDIPASQVTDWYHVPGGFRIIGWAHPHVNHLVVVDANGTVIGLGRHLPMGLPNGLLPPQGHSDDSWIAFAGESFKNETARFVVVP